VRWFGGYATSAIVAQQSVALLKSIQEDEAYELNDANSAPFLMQYNDPFQPPWKRRNEVAIPVKVKANLKE
jgi:hypothetical protein